MNHIALEYGSDTLTYRELDERSNHLYQGLAANAPEGTHIGLMINNKIEYILSLIAVMKARCVFVPLDSTYADDRIENMLRIADVKYVLTDSSNIRRLEGITKASEDINYLLVEELEKSAIGIHQEQSLPEYSPEDKIYIYFTSGSTGLPNAVLGKNKSLLHFIQWEINEFHFNQVDKMSQFTISTNDAFLRDLFVPLLSGATLCIPPDNTVLLDHSKIVKWINESQLTVIHCTPSLFRVINAEQINAECYKTLNFIFMVGERIPMNILDQWFGLFGKRIHIINLYGSTETSLAKMYYDIKPEDTNRYGIPIGKPIEGAKAIILSENMQVCKPNEIGEIYIRTPYLTYGYYNNPSLTAEKYIKNPFGTQENDFIYKTGDYGKILLNGDIEFIGRTDRQIKIRGNRIELDEIEVIINRIEGIRSCAVKFFEGESMGEGAIAAYIVASHRFNEKELRAVLDKKLDRNMMPRYIIQIKEMPLSSSGKIDYKRLKMPEKTRSQIQVTAPRNEIEKKLGDIWKEILLIEVIDVEQDFFKAGGHSLTVMKYINKIYNEFNIEIPLDVLFAKKTIAEIAQYIKEELGNDQNQYLMEITPVKSNTYYETSTAQKRIYILSQLDKSGISYNQPCIWEIKGELNLERLKDTVIQLAKRHENLRTSFHLEDGEIKQKIHKECNVDLQFSKCRIDNLQEEYMRFIRPFDLKKSPLLRIKVLKVAMEHYMLFFDIHHIISDGTTVSILMKDFGRLYNGESCEYRGLTYKDYAAWHNQLITSEYMNQEKEFWLDVFKKKVSPIDLPLDYARPSKFDFEGKHLRFKLDHELTASVKSLANESGATLFMLFLAAFNIVLAKYSGDEDIVIGSPVSGRTNPESALIAGLFVNTLAMRNQVKADMAFDQFLGHVKQNVISALQNQDYPFEQLVGELNVTRDLSRNPLFDVMFILHNMDKQEINTSSLTFMEYEGETNLTRFDLCLSAVESGKEINLEFEYRTKLFRKSTIERLSKSLIKVLESITKNTSINIYDIDAISEHDKKKLLHKFNHNSKSLQYDKNVVELFEKQVIATPDAIAVVYHDEQITYRKLHNRVNQVAGIIHEQLNENKNQPIGIMMERSVNMLVAMLGVLKVGCAYVPLDPYLPIQRLNVLIEEGNITFILSSDKQKTICNQLEDDCGNLQSCLNINQQELIQNQATTCLMPEIKKDDTAYILYTSGSTGVPKGVMIKHESISSLIASITQKINFSAGDTILALTNISFDIFVFETLVPLTQGLKVVIADEATQLDNKLLLEIIQKEHIDILQMTPSRMDLLLTNPKSLEVLREVKEIMLGGEVFTNSLAEELLKLPSTRIFNGYGPTEDTVYSTVKEVTDSREVNIGEPLDKTHIYILDQSLKCVPIGVKGELCISGAGVAKGYLNQPELTKKRFIQSPFNVNEIMYQTGDMARWLENGEIEYLGRNDNQVKIRGFRIEIGEIENAIQKIEGIHKVVVDVKEDGSNKFLCAYYTANQEYDVYLIRDILKKQLPNYMIPSYFVKLKEIPLNANGKINRLLFPYPRTSFNNKTDIEENKSDLEEKLITMWKTLTTCEYISIHDSFFDIGGDSYKVIQMQNMIEETFHIKIDVADIFSNFTIYQLANCIINLKDSKKQLEIYSINFPKEYYHSMEKEYSQTALKYEIRETQYQKLKTYIKQNSYTVDDVYFAMYLYTLSKVCGKDELTIYTLNTEDMILPVSIDLAKFNTVDELIQQIILIKNNQDSWYKYEQLVKLEDHMTTCHIFVQVDEFVDLQEVFDVYIQCLEMEGFFKVSLTYRNANLEDNKVQEFFNIYINVLSQFLTYSN